MSASVQTFTKDNFQTDVLGASTPVVVDFWAEWCAPCKAIAPIISDLATEYAGKVVFGKLDIDAHIEIPTQYGVRAIPTLMIFKDGEHVDTLVGSAKRSDIIEWVSSYV